MLRLCVCLWLCAAIAVAAFGGPQYEIVGTLASPGPAAVSLFGVASPFTATVLVSGGRFTFKNLAPGAYTVAVYIPGRGEARRTIEVGRSNADERGRVELNLSFKDSDFEFGDALRRQHTISTQQLAISGKAMRDYQDAQRDLAKHDIDSAIRRLERAVALAPQFSAAWNNLGVIAYQTQRHEQAEGYFRQALTADPNAYDPLVNLGGVLINVHKLDEALKVNSLAVLRRPNDALANSQLGMTYFALDKMDLAEVYLGEAIHLDAAHFSHPQLILAEIHLRRGERRAAADDLENFLTHHPDWPERAKVRRTIAGLRQ